MSNLKNNIFGNLTVDEFLRDYWQKKPLLIRQAFPNFKSPISADELAGLSLEDYVESRILIEKGLDGNTPWQLINGPIDEELYTKLPETNWTLLVQEANHHIPELQNIADCFSFIPNWRFDDIMISYATKNGSVGAHTDNYDVFLLQAQGQRHWHIADYSVEDKDLIPNIDSKILKEFNSEDDWILNPGDMLYLPPNIIHHGLSVDECMTYSIGFKSHTSGELLSGVLPYFIENGKMSDYYQDPNLKQQISSGKISEKAFSEMENQLHKLFTDKNQLRNYISCYLTESINLFDDHSNDDQYNENKISSIELEKYILQKKILFRNESYRYAYIETSKNHYNLFINARQFQVPKLLMDFIPLLTGKRTFQYDDLISYINVEGWLHFICFLIDEEYLLKQ